MARQSARPMHARLPSVMRWVMVVGGKGGVGTTTVAIRLAQSFVAEGMRTILVDADMAAPDVAHCLDLEPEHCLGDALAGRVSLHESVLPSDGGLQVICGRWNDAFEVRGSGYADQLVGQLATLGPHAEMLIVDAGSGGDRAVETLWRAADDVVLVTHPDDIAVMDTYATIKRHWPATRGRLWLVVNRAGEPEQAASALRRLQTVCHRFLGASLGNLAQLSDNDFYRESLRGAVQILADCAGDTHSHFQQDNPTKQQEPFNPHRPVGR